MSRIPLWSDTAWNCTAFAVTFEVTAGRRFSLHPRTMPYRPALLAACPLFVAAVAACLPAAPRAVADARPRSPLGASAYRQKLPPVRGRAGRWPCRSSW